MSYNGSGTYVSPAGQPVATGTVIQSATFNTLVTDIGNTFNNVLPRDGQASMAGQLKITDGTSSMPGIAFNSEASTGIFRPVAGALALVTSGVENLRINNAGRVMIGTTADDGTNTLQVNGATKIGGAVTLSSTLNVTGNSAVGGTLGVTGNATVGGTLAVTGATTVYNAVAINAGNDVGYGLNGGLAIQRKSGDALGFLTASLERARIDASGNVIVGTTSPINSGRLTVQQSLAGSAAVAFARNTNTTGGAAWVAADDTGNKYCEIGVLNSAMTLGADYGTAGEGYVRASTSSNGLVLSTANSSGYIRFVTGSGTERARIDNSGNFMVGRTAAITATTDVGTFERNQNDIARVVINNQNTGVAAQSMLDLEAYGAAWRLAVPSSSNNQNPLIVTTTGASTGEKMRLTYSGNLLLGTTTDTGSKLVVAGTVQSTGDASFGSTSLITAGSPGAYNSIVVTGDAVYKGTTTSVPVTVAMHNGSSIRMSQSTIQMRTNNAATDSVLIDTNGNVGIGSTATAKLDIGGTTMGTAQAVLTRGASDNNFQLIARNGSGNTAGSEHARFGMEYVGSGLAAGFSFLRGGSQMDSSLAFTTYNAERARFDSTGKLLVGRTTDDGTGAKFQINGAASVTGNVNVSSGNLFLTGQCMLGGATGSYSSYSSGLTLNYAGGGSMFGMALKPAASTTDTNALTFLSSSSTYAAATGFAAIQHLAGDAGMNLSGPWRLNGNTLISSAQPTILKPTIQGYIEQVQTLTSGASGITLNPDSGTLIYVDITANTTITLPAAAPGLSYTLVVNYNGGGWSLTFAGGTAIRWAGGTAPIATSVSGKYDKYVFTCLSGVTLGQDGGRSF